MDSSTMSNSTSWNATLTSSTPLHNGQIQGKRYGRIVYAVIATLSLLVLASILGSRAKQLGFASLRTLNLIRFLVLTLEILGICFVISATILESGFGLDSSTTCYASILVCLMFYVGSKVTMYFFLVERAHALRSPYLRRFSDWIWVAGTLTIATGFGTIAVFAFIFPLADVSVDDGVCRIGLPLKITVPLLAFDVVITAGLTGLFIHLLVPLFSVGPTPAGLRRQASWVGGAVGGGGGLVSMAAASPTWTTSWTGAFCKLFRIQQHPENSHLHPSNRLFLNGVEKLLWKSLVGAALVLAPTVANLAVLYHMKGREQGWLCLTVCTLDVTWAVCVIHWLTVDPIEVNGQLLVMGHALDASSANSISTSGVIQL